MWIMDMPYVGPTPLQEAAELERKEAAERIADYNARTKKLIVKGDAYRDTLVSERLKLRRE